MMSCPGRRHRHRGAIVADRLLLISVLYERHDPRCANAPGPRNKRTTLESTTGLCGPVLVIVYHLYQLGTFG